MIVGTYFTNDNNDTLKWIQHDAYGPTLWDLFETSKKEYLYYDWCKREDPHLRKILQTKENFDHRVLQFSHDLIAASFRYLFCPHEEIIGYPEDFDHKIFYFSAWKAYYKREHTILSRIRKIQLSILLSVAYQNTKKGYKSEDELNRQLLERYPFLDKPSYLYKTNGV